MRTDTIYEESIISKGTAGVFAAIAVIMFFLTAYQLLSGPLGERLAPTALFLVMGAVFLDLARNFSRLLIRLTPGEISVGYGLFRHRLSWSRIENCRVDETPARRYWGWGIRLAKMDGKWRLTYSVLGGPRVVLSLTTGRFRDLVFSTRNPEEVAKIVRKYAGMKGVTL